MANSQSDVYGRWSYAWEEREKLLELEFPVAEYRARIDAALALAEAAKLHALLIHGGPSAKSNLRYFSGWESFFGDSFLLMAAGREPVLITNSILHGEPMHSNIQKTWIRDFRPSLGQGTTLSMRDPVDNVGEVLADWGVAGKRIGYVDPRHLTVRTDRSLRARLAGTELADASHIPAKLRRIKSPAEIAIIRALAEAASIAMEAAIAVAVPGNTEHDVAAMLHYHLVKNGGDGSPLGMRVVAGARSAMKNVLPLRGKVIRDGEIVSIDSHGELYGYHSDHARSVVAGTPSDDQLRLLEACVAAWEAGYARIGPGMPISAIVEAMEDASRKHGFGDWDWSCGHGFGLDVVEDPIIVRNNDAVLEAGQTFFLEPMIVPTHMGSACFEDAVLVTPNGVERLTTTRLRTF